MGARAAQLRSWDDTPPKTEWRRPDFDFDPRAAGASSKEFPLADWLADAERRELFLAYLDGLVAWTTERLFPSWRDQIERRSRSTDLYEWHTALTRMVARASTVLTPADTLRRYIDPIAAHGGDDALKYVAQFTDALYASPSMMPRRSASRRWRFCAIAPSVCSKRACSIPTAGVVAKSMAGICQ